ncbi:LemA family protein [Oenococcus kitaharae]|uniref:LemA family protein n=1 Tax=Oenococcus TaxID=46254 RepID=UPI0021E8DC25|nr:LemA family protein [Oenococcus kitaharae]MCV3295693.1 LemA family protein [Oenococcus kitaharae]
MPIWLIVILVLLLLVILYTILTYNGLVKGKNNVLESSSAIDVQLKRRNDLIPNLVETVKGYASHEKTVLEDVTRARNLSQATLDQQASLNDKLSASDGLTNALGRLMAVAEAYPDLKANSNFTQLMNELSNTEDKISYTRQLFNSMSANFNTSIQQFPANLVAQSFNFKSFELLQTPENEKAVPKVDFKS